ncbi:MAG: hypothetical protein U1E73_14085 [Planctomycetota bacterium]
MRHLAALLAAGAIALPAQSPSSDVAVGVFPFLVGNMDGRVAEIVTNCQSHGIDTVYVSAFRTTGPLTGDLWITDRAGTWNPAWGAVRSTGAGIDLQALCVACRAADIRVVPVLKCFADTVQPDDLAHRQYLLDVIDYFVQAFQANGEPVYDIDGIALDYVRYVGGTNVNVANVTNFVADVRQHLGGLSLHAYLIANRYTFDGPTYNGQFASYTAVLNSLASQFGQNWDQLAQYVDVLMPMAYTANGSIYATAALHQAYVQQTALYARTACQNANHPERRVCPAIKTYTGDGETTTTSTIDASITGALLGGGDGYQAFRYQFLVNTPSWWGPMATHAVAGCNWPTPRFATASARLTTTLDAGASTDRDQPGATLQARVDFDGDGVFDTAFGPNTPAVGLARHPGTWRPVVQVRDNDGHVGTTRRRFTTPAAVTVAPGLVSALTGGTIAIDFDVGPAGGGAVYLALATLSGTSPGFVWQPGFPVPLNVDFLTASIAGNPNGGLMASGLGVFDAAGHAQAILTVPPGVIGPFAWQVVHWNFLAMDLAGQPACVGNSAPLILTP